MSSAKPAFVLASSSPRRRLLLSMAGYQFDVDSPDVDESLLSEEAPEDYVTRIAAAKAQAVAERHAPGTVVLGCDTSVVLDGRILGKPVDEADATAMLVALAGNTHTVYTGYALVHTSQDRPETGIDAARVTMRAVTEKEAQAYAATGEPLDKAGAYALQGAGKGFIDHVDGLRSTVIGLPLEPIIDLLFRYGVLPLTEGR